MSVFNRKDRRDHKDFEGNFSPLMSQMGRDMGDGCEGKCLQGPEFLPQMTQNNADGEPEFLTVPMDGISDGPECRMLSALRAPRILASSKKAWCSWGCVFAGDSHIPAAANRGAADLLAGHFVGPRLQPH